MYITSFAGRFALGEGDAALLHFVIEADRLGAVLVLRWRAARAVHLLREEVAAPLQVVNDAHPLPELLGERQACVPRSTVHDPSEERSTATSH